MKGLLKKDMLIMKQQGFMLMLFIVIVTGIAFAGSSMGSGFICGYLMMISSVLGLMTISYDEADNGYVFLMTMPFTRRTYVSSKYLICVLSGITGAVLAAVLVTVRGMILGQEPGLEHITGALVSVVCGGIVVSSIGIPTYIKFGAQKGIFAMLITCVLIVAAVFAIVKIMALYGIYLVDLLSNMDSLDSMAFALIFLAASAVIMLMSWTLSQKIMDRKEF